MDDILCPYCGCLISLRYDDYEYMEPGEERNYDCDECGKTFVYMFEILRDWGARKKEVEG